MQPALVALALDGLGRAALRFVAGLALALAVALVFAVASVTALFYRVAPGSQLATTRVEEIPSDQLAAMQAAATTCGLPWQILAALAKVGSNFGRNMATSASGRVGYGQLPPEVWAAYGAADAYDHREALPAMARYLCDHGGTSDLRGAIVAYNGADWHVAQVVAVATRYGYAPPGGSARRAVDLARAQTGMPYAWGGASPETSFDCSGLVQWAYRQGGIALPRTAQQQYQATARVGREDLRVGDLVFFQRTYVSSDPTEWITHVGIYVGDGRMINAPKEGDVVREMEVFSGFWGTHYAGAGRPAGEP